MANEDVVRGLWQAFDHLEFDQAHELLHDDFVCEWPQSRERIRGADNYITVNRQYPGMWRIPQWYPGNLKGLEKTL